jgi:type IV pilus assembly protein PilN
VIAGLFFLGLGLRVYAVRRGDEVFRERVVKVRSENAKLHDRSAFLNTLIDEQSLNWTQMFMDLEKILPAGVRVVSIQPKHDKGIVEVKLTIGALSDEAKLKFLHALEQSSSFTHVQMLSEKQVVPTNGSNDRIDVELTAVYSRT